MTKVAVIEIDGCMASSAAITHDVLATANRISAAKRVPPFKVTTVRCGSRRSDVDLRGIELVIVPGLGTPSADELETKLKSPMCRRAVDMLSAGARDRRHARRVLREHLPAGGDGPARRPAGDHDMVVRAAVPAALSRGRTADGADGRRRLADRNRWRGHGADGPDACGRRPVRRTKPGEGLRQLSPAGWAALPGAIHGDHLSGEPGPQDGQGRKMGARQHRARLCDRGAGRRRRAGAPDICPARLGDLRRFTNSVRATDQAGDRAIAARDHAPVGRARSRGRSDMRSLPRCAG